ncbi:hypothetical protein FQA39_LY17012 [Lamprigera yunnana]|nr:hypothetical protein FQA39_LY17012 [Lamprigera yunnana]
MLKTKLSNSKLFAQTLRSRIIGKWWGIHRRSDVKFTMVNLRLQSRDVREMSQERIRRNGARAVMGFYKFVIATVLWQTVATLAYFQCLSSDLCICTTIQTYYEYQCPLYDSNIVVKVFPDYGLNIQCLQNLSWHEQQLPLIQFGNAESVMFRRCPIPEPPILNLLNNLGVNRTKELQFDFIANFEDLVVSSEYFEGLESLEKIILSNNNIKQIDEDIFKNLINLTEIDLSTNFITLKPKIFQYSVNLRLLDISQNNLEYLPPELFENLSNLKHLYMWSNKFTTLNGKTFEKLDNLESLELRNTGLEFLPENIFYSLINLRVISMAMNKFTTLPQKLFKNNKHLEVIQMQRNGALETLPDYFFSNLSHLKTIELYDCKLSTLPENLFYDSVHLQNLSLNYNQLRELPETIFRGLSELENLDLSYNRIEHLPENVFYSLTNLKALNLESNKLTSIGQKLFFNLLKMESINLQENEISFVNKYSFQRLIYLKRINLSHNRLKLTENETNVSPFNSNLNLERVNLSYNNISCISEDWMYSKVHLKELDFSYNQISYLHFNYLVVVSHQLVINLSHNKISTVNFSDSEMLAQAQGNLDAYSFNGPNTVLYLDGNPIDCDCRIYDFVRYFDGSIHEMVPTLVTITADDLKCSSPKNFFNFPVKKLRPELLTCRLDQLEEDPVCPDNCACLIRPWNKAFVVYCKNQNLTEVPEIVLPKGKIFNQTEVYLDVNKITSGPVRSTAYENVTLLTLSSNNLTKLEWIPPKIQTLTLDHNAISFFNYEVLEMLNASTLSNISLGNNPWKCDCLALNFSSYLVSNLAKKQIDASNIRCTGSEKLLVHLNVNELCPNYTTMTIILSVCIAIIGLAVAACTVFYYHCELEIKVWLYAHNLCLWFVTEEEIDKDKLYDAFISYSHKDEDFVTNELMPILELGPRPYKLCWHLRDWVAGEFIPKQISSSVENSRRTLVILSPSFLQSIWGKVEFRTAHTQAMKEGRVRVIVILYGDVDLNNDLDDELKAYIKTNTYVKWGDPWFWDKLRYALPHTKLRLGKKCQKNQNIMISLNDKLDLINGIPTTPNPGTTPPILNVEPPLLLKDHPLNFRTNEVMPAAETGLQSSLVTVNT